MVHSMERAEVATKSVCTGQQSEINAKLFHRAVKPVMPKGAIPRMLASRRGVSIVVPKHIRKLIILRRI